MMLRTLVLVALGGGRAWILGSSQGAGMSRSRFPKGLWMSVEVGGMSWVISGGGALGQGLLVSGVVVCGGEASRMKAALFGVRVSFLPAKSVRLEIGVLGERGFLAGL